MEKAGRIAGLFYALDIVTGSLSLFFAGKGLGSYAAVANLVATACYVVVVVLFFQLFKPVNAARHSSRRASAWWGARSVPWPCSTSLPWASVPWRSLAPTAS